MRRVYLKSITLTWKKEDSWNKNYYNRIRAIEIKLLIWIQWNKYNPKIWLLRRRKILLFSLLKSKFYNKLMTYPSIHWCKIYKPDLTIERNRLSLTIKSKFWRKHCYCSKIEVISFNKNLEKSNRNCTQLMFICKEPSLIFKFNVELSKAR